MWFVKAWLSTCVYACEYLHALSGRCYINSCDFFLKSINLRVKSKQTLEEALDGGEQAVTAGEASK